MYFLQSCYDSPGAPGCQEANVMDPAQPVDVIDQVRIVPAQTTLQPADFAPLAVLAGAVPYVEIRYRVRCGLAGPMKEQVHEFDELDPRQIVQPAFPGIVSLDDGMYAVLAHTGLPRDRPEAL